MKIITIYEDAKASIQEFKRQRRFKKANKEREKSAELQASLAKCRGRLEICKKDFSRVIKIQCKYVAEGKEMGADTTIQEQMIWDAAIGYMLVNDAVYSLRSISSFDSVSHAYDMLGTAIDLMTARERTLPKIKITGRRGRNAYGFITSNAALKEKEEILDGFFEVLKESGDIDECLKNAKSPAAVTADRRMSYYSGDPESDESDRWAAVLDGGEGEEKKEDVGDVSLDSMLDIHPPVE